MKLRIESDGTASGTRVLTSDGQVLEGVQCLSLTLVPGQAPEAMLVIQPLELAMVVDASHGGWVVDEEPVSQQDIRALLPPGLRDVLDPRPIGELP